MLIYLQLTINLNYTIKYCETVNIKLQFDYLISTSQF